MYHYGHHHRLPCLRCHPHSYIRMVSWCDPAPQPPAHVDFNFYILKNIRTCILHYLEYYLNSDLLCFCFGRTYTKQVQHLIERCLLLHMSRDQCVKALAKHASVHPLVTLTGHLIDLTGFLTIVLASLANILDLYMYVFLAVWRELQQENREFFHAYFHSISPRHFTSKSQLSPELTSHLKKFINCTKLFICTRIKDCKPLSRILARRHAYTFTSIKCSKTIYSINFLITKLALAAITLHLQMHGAKNIANYINSYL
jgi:hypothetical protein